MRGNPALFASAVALEFAWGRTHSVRGTAGSDWMVRGLTAGEEEAFTLLLRPHLLRTRRLRSLPQTPAVAGSARTTGWHSRAQRQCPDGQTPAGYNRSCPRS